VAALRGLEFKRLVSAIIPARNEEASIARAVDSVAAQLEVSEVIVVNDQSTDKTDAILAELALRIPKLKILDTHELPAGWTGKNYAASIGAAAATGDWLLFTDADTYHSPGAARRALADASEHGAVLVSYSPEQEMESFGERALIPFVFCRLSAHYSFSRVNDPALPDAAANGQFLMLRRDAYEAIGGHASVAGLILEDVALARCVKHAGYAIFFTARIGLIRTRMYRSFGAMWQGWTKNLYPLVGGKPLSVLLELIEATPILETLLLFSAALYMNGDSMAWTRLGPTLFAGLLLYGLLRYAIALHRNLFSISYVQYYAAGVCLYSAALITSWWRNTHGAVAWKGRKYPAKGTS
jgi:glycosyltransferase involved in cell wall biosynthesis